MSIDEMLDMKMPFDEIKHHLLAVVVLNAMKREQGNSGRAAERLRIHRNTVYRVLDEAGLVKKNPARARRGVECPADCVAERVA